MFISILKISNLEFNDPLYILAACPDTTNSTGGGWVLLPNDKCYLPETSESKAELKTKKEAIDVRRC